MKLSLRWKATLLIVLVGLLIGAAGILECGRGINDVITNEYERRSVEIAGTMAVTVDAERVRNLRDAVLEIYDSVEDKILSDQWGTPAFEEYISHFSGIEETEDFLALRQQLRSVQDLLDVNCLYITWLDVSEERTVYLVDAAYEDACPPGCLDPIYGEDHPALKDPEVGFAPNVTRTEEYGYLVATAMPIFTDDGEWVGYAAVDISMEEIVRLENSFLLKAAVIFGIVTVIVSLFGILMVNRSIIRPITSLSEIAERYTTADMKFSSLSIRSGDEIETLANSMVRMEKDIAKYIDTILETRSDLASERERAEILKREANVDALTGLRNKRAYDLAVDAASKEGCRYGIVMIDLNDLKGINDGFGHDKGDAAIRGLAALTCRVFKHSPVFRIGGDEFVVLLKGEELEKRESLTGRFRDEIRKLSENTDLEPWKKHSAACGCAVFDPAADHDANDVFKRADAAMYEQKAKMKSAAEK